MVGDDSFVITSGILVMQSCRLYVVLVINNRKYSKNFGSLPWAVTFVK